jgi:hypothetical protein
MLSRENNAVPFDRELLEDIEYANQVRAYERGLSKFCPEPREKDRFVYVPPEESKIELDARVQDFLNAQRKVDEISETTRSINVPVVKKQSHSTFVGADQHTNRTTVPSQNRDNSTVSAMGTLHHPSMSATNDYFPQRSQPVVQIDN